MNHKLKQVETFWSKNLCGSHFVNEPYLSEEFFRQYSQFRYKKEHHLNDLIDWESAKGKDILEIGLGIGTDGVRWAKNAKSYTGIDLTEESVKATTKHFALLGLRGKILQGSAEALPFDDQTYDLVYSHGVIQHTPDIIKALQEIRRVLKPGGEVILMLYSKDSFNYWIRIQFYFRIRFLYELMKKRMGLKNNEPWTSHVKNYSAVGQSYFGWRNWHHHCTDGPGCQLANIYHKSEIKQILSAAGFSLKKMEKAHFPLGGKYPKIERFIARRIGFYQFVWGVKR